MGYTSTAMSAETFVIPESKSLQQEIAVALKRMSPLIVFVSLDNCPFCKIGKENYLRPLVNEQQAHIVQINFRSSSKVINALGDLKTQDQVIRDWGIKVAPTLLFLGKDGIELAPRLAGGTSSDFYGAYLDDRLELAKETIRRDFDLKK